MPVDYSEKQGSPREGWDTSGFRATRELICNWNVRQALMTELYGQPYPFIAPINPDTWDEEVTYDAGDIVRYGEANFAYVSLVDDNFNHEPTDIDWWQYLIIGIANVVSMGAVPYDNNIAQMGSGSEAAYEKALVTVEYARTPAENQTSPDAFSESLEPTAEFLTLDPTKFAWLKQGDPAAIYKLAENEAPGKLLRGLAYVHTRYNQTSIPADVQTLLGCINADAVIALTLGRTFEAHTLLYTPPTLIRTVNEEGIGTWTITRRFIYKPNWEDGSAMGWNYFWRAETQKYERIYLYNTDTPVDVYPEANFVF